MYVCEVWSVKCKEQSYLEPRALQGRGSRYSTYMYTVLYVPKVANNNSLQHPTYRKKDGLSKIEQ